MENIKRVPKLGDYISKLITASYYGDEDTIKQVLEKLDQELKEKEQKTSGMIQNSILQ